MIQGAYYRLRRDVVRDRIQSRGLKLWWVAEYTGVHRTTLRRWLSGGIDRIAVSNIEKLAKVIEEDPRLIVE